MVAITMIADDARARLEVPLAPAVLEPIQRAFENWAHETPQAIALESEGGQVWTYGELDRLSSAFAALLERDGVAPGDIVAIVTDRSPELVCCMLAVLKAGAAFAMVNEAYPDARIASCLNSSRARSVLLVGAARRFADAAWSGVSRRVVPSERAELERAVGSAATPPASRVTFDTTAYVMFTSGTTGTPKCVATGHAPLPHFLRWQRETFGFSAGDRFSMLSGLSHDPLLRDVFAPLSLGATLCIPAPSTLLDPNALQAFLDRARVTVAHLTPPLGQVILAAADGARLDRLRFWFWGGDVLRLELVEQLRAISAARHVNFYGTTETPQAVGFFEVGWPSPVARIPIGRGIADFELCVRTPAGGICQTGELGELWVRSRYLSQGYLGDDAGGTSRYVVNMRTADPTDRLYSTGDLALYLADGNVELRGRADDQVKVRGFRVELGEVTSALLATGLARDGLALARYSGEGEAQIVAFMVPRTGVADPTRAVSDALKVALPAYARPASLVALSMMPLLPNGKIDRKALLAMPGAGAVAPRDTQLGNAREQELARIWASVLGVKSVGITESFYDLGGDSLTAIRVMVGMRRAGVDEATCRQILRGRSIAQLASGDGAAPATSEQREPNERRRMVVSGLRGLMVVLMVASHWIDGVARREPRLAQAEATLAPLLGWPTPGFAIAFGVSLATMYQAYTVNPSRTSRLLYRSAGIVAAGALLLGIDHWLLIHFHIGHLLHERALRYPILTSLDGVLVYYAAALLSVPLWFKLLQGARPAAKCLAIAALLATAYAYLLSLPLDWGSHLSLSVVMGKFSYLNLSAGAFAGLGFGLAYRSWLRMPGWLVPLALGLIAAGTGLAFLQFPAGPWHLSGLLHGWAWPFWGGGTLLALAALDRLLRGNASWITLWGQRMSVLGQLALPLVLLDFISRDLGYLGAALGSGLLRVVIPLLVFFAGAALLFRKTYGFLYGADALPERPNVVSV